MQRRAKHATSQSQLPKHKNKHTDPKHKNNHTMTNYSCIISIYPNPKCQVLHSSKKHLQKRIKIDFTKPKPNNNNTVKEYNHITTCLSKTKPTDQINEHNIPNNFVNITIPPHINMQSNRTRQISCHAPRQPRHSNKIAESRKERQTSNMCD